ncbi:hypothetical protein HMI56_002311 [Coelomomyces lativittatus]|nr:hypothetical protein HMI56_002311 [Coelomomyces lativittatus]
MVLSYRSEYVNKMGIPEFNKKYLSNMQSVIIDKDAIKVQVLAEERKLGLAN